jgi:hypothetical protein
MAFKSPVKSPLKSKKILKIKDTVQEEEFVIGTK